MINRNHKLLVRLIKKKRQKKEKKDWRNLMNIPSGMQRDALQASRPGAEKREIISKASEIQGDLPPD